MLKYMSTCYLYFSTASNETTELMAEDTETYQLWVSIIEFAGGLYINGRQYPFPRPIPVHTNRLM
jgi:hypothetical protein